MAEVTIIGAGLAGLSAALQLAEQHISCRLVSVQASERAQSVLAEGGINAALDVMGESDSPAQHFVETMQGGCDLANSEAVRALTEHAPDVVRYLQSLGVPFSMEDGKLVQRFFGGQKKRRATYCKGSTGKVLMTALIDAVNKQEGVRLQRFPHHGFVELELQEDRCVGVWIRDLYTEEQCFLEGPVLLACGGPGGLFPGATTGSVANEGNVLATIFRQGVELANLEFLQYHPTTAAIPGKRLLISEAARGEGGRLFVERQGERWYFMEEKYPEMGNLMPRDVVSREIANVLADPDCGDQVYLDLTGLSGRVWQKSLPDLREEVRDYLELDPAKEPIPIAPGIHFFMGGIRVDRHHRTSVPGLYAAGECACQYHGANRLGGNSLLGAIYGGQVAARQIAQDLQGRDRQETMSIEDKTNKNRISASRTEARAEMVSPVCKAALGDLLLGALGVIRRGDRLEQAIERVQALYARTENQLDRDRVLLGEAMLRSALARKESRGAHQRADYPARNDETFLCTTVAQRHGEAIEISFASKEDEPG